LTPILIIFYINISKTFYITGDLHMWTKKKSDHLTDDEKHIIDLLLSGESKLLAKLREQMMPGFHLYVERKISSRILDISFVFDGNTETQFTAGSSVTLEINDLFIRDNRIPVPIHIRGLVHYGILGKVLAVVESDVEWPKTIKADDWGFASHGSKEVFSVKTRQVIPEYEADMLEMIIHGRPTPSGWLSIIIHRATNENMQFNFMAPATKSQIENLEKSISCGLPTDYLEFVQYGNGGNLWGYRVLGTAEAYLLDNENPNDKQLVFCQHIDGSNFVFSLAHKDAVSGLCPVDCYFHDEEQPSQFSKSFIEWMQITQDESLRLR
jgi:hypothetical protein